MTRAELTAAAEALIEVARMPNIEYVADAHNDAVRKLRKYFAELRAQAEAVPEDEPVAWIKRVPSGAYLRTPDVMADIPEAEDGVQRNGWEPLYTRPDPRVKELEELLREALGSLMGDYEINPREVMQRIAAALKGKP